MQRHNQTFALVSFALLAGVAPQTLLASFHLWQISEIFSSADGAIQYIELRTTADGQQLLNGVSLISTNATGGSHGSVQFSGNLSGSTANKTVLIATAGFASLTGLTPDYLINSGFLPTGGGAINFGSGVSTLSYSAAQLPRNGVQSINASLEPATASPVNFTGLTATLTAPVYANFDTSAGILNLPVVDVPGTGLANVSFDVDLVNLRFVLRNDFFLYNGGIVAGGNAAQLQGGSVLFIPSLPIGNELYSFKVSILGDNPITFGNPSDIVITNFVPTPAPQPEPEPEPQPTALQQSITRGESQYAQQCAECHGGSGEGGTGPSMRTSALNSFNPLRARIDQTMPQLSPASCRDSGTTQTCATDTANYILNVFQQSQTVPDDVEINPY